MNIKDKRWGWEIDVEVRCEQCNKYTCYRPHPSSTEDALACMWYCKTRQMIGCPEQPELLEEDEE